MKRFFAKLFGENIVVVYMVVAIVYAVITINVTDLTWEEAFLQSFLFWCVGWFLAVSFFLHWIRPSADRIAEGLGWSKGSPWQKEVAAADGAFGILGIICGFTSPGDFWTATAIGASFMLFMMGVGHVIDTVKSENRSPLNAGSTMYFGLLIPVVLVVFLILSSPWS
ncbi:MAG: DUF6790 family protein [Actinomycetota bacterium]|nr:DUF6790 family protein [Actinomycetota bacterium]